MSCQHVWRYVPASNIKYGYYNCEVCDADMTVTQYEAIQQAHREGWEQAKAAISNRVSDLAFKKDGEWIVFELSLKRDIATMEYGGANELPQL